MEEQAIDRTNSALHGYQQQLVDCISKGQNHIIVAPTGSGKTRVAVEVAGLLFQRKPSARILFLTPTVALAEQQTGQYFAVCPGQSRLGLAVPMCVIAILHYTLHCNMARTACCGTWLFCYASFILMGVVCGIKTSYRQFCMLLRYAALCITCRVTITICITILFCIRHLPRDFLVPFAV